MRVPPGFAVIGMARAGGVRACSGQRGGRAVAHSGPSAVSSQALQPGERSCISNDTAEIGGEAGKVVGELGFIVKQAAVAGEEGGDGGSAMLGGMPGMPMPSMSSFGAPPASAGPSGKDGAASIEAMVDRIWGSCSGVSSGIPRQVADVLGVTRGQRPSISVGRRTGGGADERRGAKVPLSRPFPSNPSISPSGPAH